MREGRTHMRPGGLILGGVTLGALLLGGCGNLTSGGLGDVEVIVAVDSVPAGDLLSQTAGGGAALAFAGEDGFGSAAEFGAGDRVRAPQVPPEPIEGTLTVRIQVYVLRSPLRWVEVTDGVQEVEMPLAGAVPVTLAQKSIPAGPYVSVRTVFRRVEADVERGLEVDGVAVTGPVPVDLGPQDRLVVERPVALDVTEGLTSSLAVDLHTMRWLRLLDRDRKRVSQEDFTGQLDLRRRP